MRKLEIAFILILCLAFTIGLGAYTYLVLIDTIEADYLHELGPDANRLLGRILTILLGYLAMQVIAMHSTYALLTNVESSAKVFKSVVLVLVVCLATSCGTTDSVITDKAEPTKQLLNLKPIKPSNELGSINYGLTYELTYNKLVHEVDFGLYYVGDTIVVSNKDAATYIAYTVESIH